MEFLNLTYLKKIINKHIDIERLLEILDKNKDNIYEIVFFYIFLIILYFLINSLLINPLFKILSKNKKSNIDRIKTIIRGLKNLISLALILIFVFFLLNKLGIKLSVLLTSAGVLGATLLVIFQNSIRDFLSGWLFVIEDTFRENEYIMINNTFKGRVYNLKSRYLILRGDNGELVMIPYGQINFVHNFSRKRTINKVSIKIKKENYSESKINDFRLFLTDLSNKNEEIGEPEIIEVHEVGENYIEILIKFKTPFYLSSNAKTIAKKEFLHKFGDMIIEIKDAS